VGVVSDAVRFARRQSTVLSGQQLSDAQVVSEILPQVVLEFSRLCPRRGEYEIPLTAGVSLYDLPGPLVLEIKEHSYAAEIGIDASGFLGLTSLVGFSSIGSGGGCGGADGPTLLDLQLDQAERAQLAQAFPVSVHVVGHQVEVVPTPTAAGTLHVRTADAWDVDLSVFDPSAPNLDDIVDFDVLPIRLRLTLNWVVCAFVATEELSLLSKHRRVSIGSNSRVSSDVRGLQDLIDRAWRKAREHSTTDGAAVA